MTARCEKDYTAEEAQVEREGKWSVGRWTGPHHPRLHPHGRTALSPSSLPISSMTLRCCVRRQCIQNHDVASAAVRTDILQYRRAIRDAMS